MCGRGGEGEGLESSLIRKRVYGKEGYVCGRDMYIHTCVGEIDAEEVKLSLKLLGLDVSDADVRQLLVK